MIRQAYRISKAVHAASMWTGIGAREYGGRWNSKGFAVVYTAQSKSLAALEQLVHLVKPRILKDFVCASIDFDDAKMQRIAAASLPAGWNDPRAPAALRKFGDDWITAAKFAVLAVPSVITPGEWNYLFNPAHPEFHGYQKSPPEPFLYDNRLA